MSQSETIELAFVYYFAKYLLILMCAILTSSFMYILLFNTGMYVIFNQSRAKFSATFFSSHKSILFKRTPFNQNNGCLSCYLTILFVKSIPLM